MESLQAGTLRTQHREALKRFTPDRGDDITEPKGQARLTDMSFVTKLLTQIEKTAIDTFYWTTCIQGSIKFDMTDPESAATATYKFKSPPAAQLDPGNDEYRVTVNLVRFD